MPIFTHPIYIKGDNGDEYIVLYFIFRSPRQILYQKGQILSKFEQNLSELPNLCHGMNSKCFQNASKMLLVTIVTETDGYSTVSRTILVVLNVI